MIKIWRRYWRILCFHLQSQQQKQLEKKHNSVFYKSRTVRRRNMSNDELVIQQMGVAGILLQPQLQKR